MGSLRLDSAEYLVESMRMSSPKQRRIQIKPSDSAPQCCEAIGAIIRSFSKRYLKGRRARSWTGGGQCFHADLCVSSKNRKQSTGPFSLITYFLVSVSLFFFYHYHQIMGLKCPVRFAHKKIHLFFYLSQIIYNAQILRKFNRVCPYTKPFLRNFICSSAF